MSEHRAPLSFITCIQWTLALMLARLLSYDKNKRQQQNTQLSGFREALQVSCHYHPPLRLWNMDPACWLKKGSRLLKQKARGNFSVSPTWSSRPMTGCGERSSSLWVHRTLFWQLSRDGNLHGLDISLTMTASPKPSFRAPWGWWLMLWLAEEMLDGQQE